MMHLDSIIAQILAIVALGTVCQLVAWRIGVPSIVLLLPAGVVLGPLGGIVQPDQVFGQLLRPLVQLAVGLVLFEAGTTLRLKDVPHIGKVVSRLLSIGVVVTFVGIALAAWGILDLPFSLALLVAALLVVSGPTVIIPLLRSMRPKAPLGAILRWEGIIIDPIGVVLAVLVAEIVLNQYLYSAPLRILVGAVLAFSAGAAAGGLGGWLCVKVLQRHWLPDQLQFPFFFALFLAAFVGANVLHVEAGLVAATVFGLVLGEYGGKWSKAVVEFNASMQPLLVGCLFIILSARLSLNDLSLLSWSSILFLAVLIFVVRPLAVAAAAYGTSLKWRERVLLAGVAPRGIVAASLASVLALDLQEAGFEQAVEIVPIVFCVILVSVFWYGLLSVPLAQLLGVREIAPQGMLLVGASPFACALAAAIQKLGLVTALVDSNETSAQAAVAQGLRCYVGNALADEMQEQINFEGIGRVLAVTPNDEANTLAAVEYGRIVGSANVYQLAPGISRAGAAPMQPRGRTLFQGKPDWQRIDSLWDNGFRPKLLDMAEWEALAKTEAQNSWPILLARISGNGRVELNIDGIDLSNPSGLDGKVLVFGRCGTERPPSICP